MRHCTFGDRPHALEKFCSVYPLSQLLIYWPYLRAVKATLVFIRARIEKHHYLLQGFAVLIRVYGERGQRIKISGASLMGIYTSYDER